MSGLISLLGGTYGHGWPGGGSDLFGLTGTSIPEMVSGSYRVGMLRDYTDNTSMLDWYRPLWVNSPDEASWWTGSFLVRDAVEPIPEPTTIVLMGFGILGLLGIVIRQRRKVK